MAGTYQKLKSIYNKNRMDVFVMAVSHLFDIGVRNAVKITDEEISELEGNGLMTQEFVQDLVRLSREIGSCASPVEIIMFCQVMELFDTEYFSVTLDESNSNNEVDNFVKKFIEE